MRFGATRHQRSTREQGPAGAPCHPGPRRRRPRPRVAAVGLAAVLGLVASAVTAIAPAGLGGPSPAAADQANDYEASVLADNPVSFWPLSDTDGGAHDVQQRNNGYLYGGVTTGVSGPFAGSTAMRFDGQPCTGVDVARDPWALTGSKVSIEAWVRQDAPRAGIVYRWRYYGFDLFVDGDGVPSFGGWLNGWSGFGVAATGFNVADGRWHHIVGTKDDTTVTMYVDGVAAATASSEPGLYFGGNNGVAIGRDAWACDGVVPSFAGDVANAAFYNQSLSAARVAAHYAGNPAPEANRRIVFVHGINGDYRRFNDPDPAQNTGGFRDLLSGVAQEFGRKNITVLAYYQDVGNVGDNGCDNPEPNTDTYPLFTPSDSVDRTMCDSKGALAYTATKMEDLLSGISAPTAIL